MPPNVTSADRREVSEEEDVQSGESLAPDKEIPAWLTSRTDLPSSSDQESESSPIVNDTDSDISRRQLRKTDSEDNNARSDGDDASSDEDDLHGKEQPVPSTISRGTIRDSAAGGSIDIDLQILAEKGNKLALAGRVKRRRKSRSPSNIHRGYQSRPPGPPGPPVPIPMNGGGPPLPPQKSAQPSLLNKIRPGNTLHGLFAQNWSNAEISGPYRWRERLRVTGRRKSESNLDDYRQKKARSPLLSQHPQQHVSSRNIVSGWRLKGRSTAQMEGAIPASNVANQSFQHLGAELGRVAERSFGLDLLDDSSQSLFIGFLLDTIEGLRYERNFMENLLMRPIAQPVRPPSPVAPAPSLEGPVKIVPRRQVLHRVFCFAQYHEHEKLVVFEDAPVKSFSERSGDFELEGTIIVTDPDRYCVENPDIAFIVFKEYQCEQGEWPRKNQSDRIMKRPPRPPLRKKITPRSEQITIVSEELRRAIESVALCDPQSVINHRSRGDIKIEMDAPYLFLYHHRAALRKFADEESGSMTEHVLVLLDYIRSDLEAEYREADEQFASGKLIDKHIDKLFRPNDIVIKKTEKSVMAYVISTWPYRYKNALQLDCWSWVYTGVILERNHSGFQIDLPLPEDFTIARLPCFPISKADPAVIEELRTRGRKFWSMKERYFGCYSGLDEKRTKHVSRIFRKGIILF
jgi:hypothetical protein